MDAVEQLVLTDGDGSVSGPEIFADTPILCEDPALAQVRDDPPGPLIQNFPDFLF